MLMELLSLLLVVEKDIVRLFCDGNSDDFDYFTVQISFVITEGCPKIWKEHSTMISLNPKPFEIWKLKFQHLYN